jgi:hypothetical protein
VILELKFTNAGAMEEVVSIRGVRDVRVDFGSIWYPDYEYFGCQAELVGLTSFRASFWPKFGLFSVLCFFGKEN